MSKLQQTIFMNLSRHSKYHERNRFISQPYAHFARNRGQEIANEFDLVDFEGKDSLTKQEILDHFHSKYGSLEFPIIQTLFDSMNWGPGESISKDEFCRKYLAREKQLYHEANALYSMRQRLETTRAIFEQTKRFKPQLYANINIERLYIKSDRQGMESEDYLSLQVEYQDHDHKLDYLIEQPVYNADESSFELLLPVQQHYFFLKYRFIDPRSKTKESFGQCYVNYPVADILLSRSDNKIKRVNTVRTNITKNNEVKGFCQFTIVFESEIEKIEEKMITEQAKVGGAREDATIKQRQYEYLQYIWGIKDRHPHKIAKEDVKGIIISRLVAGSLLVLLSIIVHCLGRSEPLSIMVALMLFRSWKYVMLRTEKFLLAWLVITAICLDLIWVGLASETISLVNYMQLSSAVVFTYIMIVSKIVLLFYLLLIEKAFAVSNQ